MSVSVVTYPTMAEAGRALSSARDGRAMGGGTILMRAVNEADTSLKLLIRTTDPAFTAITAGPSQVTLGAGVTMSAIVKHRDTAFLAPVARVIGGPQVRSAATVAGNLFAAPPYGDFAGALMALGATVELADGRKQPVDSVMRAHGSVFVSAIHVPVPEDGLLFKKVSRVKPKGVSLMSIAAVVPRRGGRIGTARIVFNGMGPRPMRAAAAEQALTGRPVDRETIDRAAAAAARGLDPQDDPVATAWYRREVASVHLGRLLEEIL